MKLFYKTLVLSLALLVVAMPADVLAQKKKKKKGAEAAPQKKESKFEKLTKDATLIEGFFNFYQTKDGKLYMAIPEDKLNNDFLMTFEISQGIGASYLFGGTMLNIFEGEIMSLEKYDGKIFLVKKPHQYVGNTEATRKAVELSFGSSVLQSAKIETEEKDSIMLINVHPWFVSDMSQVSNRVKYAVSPKPGQPGSANLDKSRSHLIGVKSYPENSNVNVKLTFKTSGNYTPRTVPDARYIPISIHYSLVQLPEEPMKPREGDDRLGNFFTVHKDFSDDNNQTFFKRYVNKWRLECDGAAGSDGLCDVKEPIVYYIDRTVPEDYVQPFIDGVEAWNDAFEAAGFRNAIKAERLPDDADPEDVRYATLRWNTSDISGYGAIGPSMVDPRTGEILDADILFEANMFLGIKNTWRRYINPSTALNSILNMTEEDVNQMDHGFEMAGFADFMAAQGNLVKSALVAKGEMAANGEIPEEILHQFVKWVTMHEVGHTLGLQHNFKSSADTPFDKLHDKKWAEENGIYSSVMEYPTPNLSPKGEENGYYWTPGIGSYDRWVISYAYTPDDNKAKEIARQAAQPGHSTGSNPDSGGPGAIDPTINVFDLSSDPLEWGKQRSALVKEIMDELPSVVLSDNTPYYELTNAYANLMFQYAYSTASAIKYIGGQYQYRHHKGDPDQKQPFEMVPKAEQEEALALISKNIFSENAFALPQEIVQQFGANRWYHWGSNFTYNGRIDFPYYEITSGLQRSIMGQLVHPWRMARIRDAELKYGKNNVVGIPQLFETLTKNVWSEVWGGSGKNISTLRRDLQRAHIDAMTGILNEPPSRMPADARAVARYRLSDLRSRINRAMNNGRVDTYTRAHLMESRARIDKALEASLSVKK